MAESYSERHGRKPRLDIDGLIQFVFTEFAELERRGYFWEAFNSYEIHGEEHEARLLQPERYVITKLGRPGLWKWLGDTERVVAEEDFPTWDRDTLFDVVELFHNLVVAAPILDAEGTFEGYSRPTGQRDFREAINEGLALADPPAQLDEDGRITETAADGPESQEKPTNNIFISYVHENGNDAAERLAESLKERGFQVSLVDQLTTAADPSGSRVAVLGPGFLEGNWTRAELDLLADREPPDGREPIILVSHGIDADQVRAIDPVLAQRPDLSIDLGLDLVVDAIARALQRGRRDEPQTPGAGSEDDGHAASPAAEERGSFLGWFVKHKDQLLIGIVLLLIGAVITAGIKRLPGLLDSNSGSSSTVGQEGGGSGGDSTGTNGGGGEPEASTTVVEYADNTLGSPVFADPKGTTVEGSDVIPYRTEVEVSCFAPNESGGMPSVNGFYLIASGPWKGDYVVADTMTNGGAIGDRTSPSRDKRVPPCNAET
jgi:hypothetical protein